MDNKEALKMVEEQTSKAAESIIEGSVFRTLMSINPSAFIEKKGNLNYISWGFAWMATKNLYPNASYCIRERNTEYGPVNYFTDGKTCWVEVEVRIPYIDDKGDPDVIIQAEQLPVLDFKNKPIPYDNINSFAVNSSIKRCLVKALALCGFGLGVYIGEDLLYLDEEGDLSKAAKDDEKFDKAKAAKVDESLPVTEEQLKIIKSYEGATKERVDKFITGQLKLNDYNELSAKQASLIFELVKKYCQ